LGDVEKQLKAHLRLSNTLVAVILVAVTLTAESDGGDAMAVFATA